MSGETEREVSGWTVDTLHVHIDHQFSDLRLQLDERFRSQQEMVQTALTSAEKAVTKAEGAAEKRFDSVNEFRLTLTDQQRTFLTRGEYDAQHKALADRVDDLAARLDKMTGNQSAGYRFIGWGLAAMAIFISIIVFASNYLTK